MSAPRVILASSSPRRHDLLELIGIRHEVIPANIDESIRGRESPTKHAERLAREKAGAIASRDPESVAIGADTIVLIDKKILGKPANSVDAGSMLRLLSGREHTVVTAVAVARGKQVDPTLLPESGHKASAGYTSTGPDSKDAKEGTS